MFVQDNTLAAIRNYFRKELIDLFSENEIKSIVKEMAVKRLDISDIDFVTSSDIKLSESDLLHFNSILKRLKSEEPFQYILGETWFYDLNLKCDNRALIPRPETEELVDWIFKDCKNDLPNSILDVCSGSGCISLALKSLFPEAIVTSLEYSSDACALINENQNRTGLSVEILEADALSESTYHKFQKSSFDVWVSNPPYIPEKDRGLMSKNVLEHEPDMALFVEDDDALIFYREIALKALQYLKEGGALYFEIHEDLSPEVVALLEGLGFVNIEVRKDLQNKDRMVKALKVSSRHESE